MNQYSNLLVVISILFVLLVTACGKPQEATQITSKPWPIDVCPVGYTKQTGSFGTSCECVNEIESIACGKPNNGGWN